MLPLLAKLPTPELKAHVTAVLLVPETVAVNVCCWDGNRETVEGVNEIVTGVTREMLRAAEAFPKALLALTLR